MIIPDSNVLRHPETASAEQIRSPDMSDRRPCWICWMSHGGNPRTEPGDVYCQYHGHLAVEYEQDGRRWVTGGLSRAWLESDVLQPMR